MKATSTRRLEGLALGAAMALALAACAGDADQPTGSAEGPGVTPAAGTTEPPATEPASPGERSFVLSVPGDGPTITVTLPGPEWDTIGPGILVRDGNADPPDGAALIAPYFGELWVYGDPCQWGSTLPDAPATTVDQFVTAVTAQASRNGSAPMDTTVDGHAGKSMTIHVPDDTVFAEGLDDPFTECDLGTFASWAGGGEPVSAGPSRWQQGPGQIDELWILDVDGELVVIDAMYGAQTPQAHLAEINAILDSMTFDE